MEKQNLQTHIFRVNGMHCNACVILTESELQDVPYVAKAKSSLKYRSVEVTGYFDNKSMEEIAAQLSEVLTKHGYTLSTDAVRQEKKLDEFRIAIPVALAFVLLFITLQKTGFINIIGEGNVSYGTAFLVGIVASLSTCMAVVGGLLLSMSATFAKEGDKIKPQALFHIGRLVSFFFLGGAIGMIGEAFTLNASVALLLNSFIGIVMLILGINLLDIYHWPKQLQPSMPKIFSTYTANLSKINHTFTPFFVGVATFFLPCGFTQSMQLYTLSTESFLRGGMTMLAFAAGTLPVLALISFSSVGIKNKSRAGIFFKTAGLIVIAFALFNIYSSLVISGIISPVINL